jgi:hypothetical protein
MFPSDLYLTNKAEFVEALDFIVSKSLNLKKTNTPTRSK